MDKPVLLIDNFDSFTHMLADYIKQAGASCEIRRNTDSRLVNLDPNHYLALVISPGPETPKQAGLLMEILPKFLESIPCLGICLGHQAIGQYYGAHLGKAQQPRHGKVDLHEHIGNELFKGVPKTFFATRYHSLTLTDLPEMLLPICFSKGEIMGLAHKHLAIWGLQFHPESCESPDGLGLIKNFLAIAKRMARK